MPERGVEAEERSRSPTLAWCGAVASGVFTGSSRPFLTAPVIGPSCQAVGQQAQMSGLGMPHKIRPIEPLDASLIDSLDLVD